MKNKNRNMEKFTKKELIIKCSIIIFILVFDIISKMLLNNKNIILINGVLSFTSTHNTGAAFSTFSDNVILLTAVTIFVLIAFTFYDYFLFERKNLLSFVAFSFIFGGAIGNMVDRISLGYVRDFISLDFINFAVFNVADSFLTIGVILFCINLLFVLPKKEKKEKEIND